MTDGLFNLGSLTEALKEIIDALGIYFLVPFGVWLALLMIGIFIEMWQGR